LRIEAAFLVGQLEHDNSRLVNDNLKRNGVDYAEANYNSFWLSPEISVGTDLEIINEFVLTPTIRGRYAVQWFDGYTETGSDANATVDEQNAAVGELVAELAATKAFDFGTVTGRAGVLGRFGMGDEEVNVTMIGTTNAISTDNTDIVAGFVGLETSVWLSDNTALNVAGQAMIGDDVTRFQGTASLGMKF
jgi:hypothetical protein